MIRTHTRGTRLRQIVPAALIAAAAALGGTALGDLATASALPSKEVADKWTKCVNQIPDNGGPGPNHPDNAKYKKCCVDAGGTWTEGPNAIGCNLPDAPKNVAATPKVTDAGPGVLSPAEPAEPNPADPNVASRPNVIG